MSPHFFFSESLKVAKALSSVSQRPLSKALSEVGKVAEKSATAVLASDVVQDVLGPDIAKDLKDKAAQGSQAASGFVGSIREEGVRRGLQSAADAGNGLFKSANLDVKILGPESSQWAKIKILEDLQDRAQKGEKGLSVKELNPEGANASSSGRNLLSESPQALGPTFTREKAREFVGIMKQARKARGGDHLLQKYIDNSLLDARFKRVRHLPSALERKLYYDILRTSLQVFEIGMMNVHNGDIVGHAIQVDLTHIDNNLKSHDLNDPNPASRTLKPTTTWTKLNEDRVSRVVEDIISSHPPLQKYNSYLPQIEKQFITTISQVTLRLMADLFSDERMRVRVLGHRVRWSFEPMGLDELEKMIQSRNKDNKPRASVNRAAIKLFVDELLKDEDLNLLWLPDVIESEIYEHALTTVMCILEESFASTDMSLLGLNFNLSLVSAVEALPAKGSENRVPATPSVLSEASEDKISMVYASEAVMRERLEGIYKESALLEHMLEQRELNVPLKEKDGIKRTLSADWKVDAKKRARASVVEDTDLTGSNSKNSGASSEEIQKSESKVQSSLRLGLADESKVQFQKLAAQERLARFLQVRKVLGTMPIDIPFEMIRNVEEYAAWMPLCTGGEMIAGGENPKTRVSFGIETGTFLGVLGDAVVYEIKVEEAKEVEKGKTWVGRIVADTGKKG